jgi:hypothetical protein
VIVAAARTKLHARTAPDFLAGCTARMPHRNSKPADVPAGFFTVTLAGSEL